MLNAELTGQYYRDYLITKSLPLKELESTLWELVHEPTGARILHIANADPENLFCLGFQTFPYSSNGIAHILEHIVLCGSQKFPVKDPFFAMTRRSLNTYMNALTGQDFTCYPASSQIEKDFYNLLEVYLDAAFHPNLKKESFLQEGHRLEFLDSSENSPLCYHGVVYNEMKGAMNSSDARLSELLFASLYPDLPYAYNSGGDPKEIPTLRYEELLEFHEQYYHPSRCLFFFYGNLPLSRHLNFLEKTLQHTSKLPPLAPLSRQKRFLEPVRVEGRYPIGGKEETEKKTEVAFAFLTSPIERQTELLALSVLDAILTDHDGSFLTRALLKSGLCTQVESSLGLEMSEAPWIFVCKGCDSSQVDRLEKLFFETLQAAQFLPEQIQAALHQIEFERTEIGAEGIPFGLTLFFRSALLKQHGCEPENGLLIHSLFSELRSHLQDPNYLPNLLQKTLLANPHWVRAVLKPDPHLTQKELQEETAKLQKIKALLTEEEKDSIRKEKEQFQIYLSSCERQSLDCLPSLLLNDLPAHGRVFPLLEKKGRFYHSCFTNQIVYADLFFDLPKVPQEDLSLLSFFVHLLTEVGSGGRNYEETLAYQQAYIGEFNASLSLHVSCLDPNRSRPTLSLRGKALERNAPHLFRLFSDTLQKLDLEDEERIQEWLLQHATEKEQSLHHCAMSYATQASLSGLDASSFIQNEWHGIPYYQTVLKLAKKLPKSLFEKLRAFRSHILGAGTADLVLSCDLERFIPIESECLKQLSFPQKPCEPWKPNPEIPVMENRVYWISSPVAFTSLAMSTISYAHPDAPFLLIAAELMSHLVLHKKIREKGGAYGSGASYSSSSGTFHFHAYRDPHLASSIRAFHEALSQIAKGDFSSRDLLEAKLSVLQNLDAPIAPGQRASLSYAWQRAEKTDAMREAFRRKVLQAQSEEVARSVEEHLLLQPKMTVSLLGEDLYRKEKKDLDSPFVELSF